MRNLNKAPAPITSSEAHGVECERDALTAIAVQEGFHKPKNPDEVYTALFSQMKPGSFQTLSYPEGDIAEDVGKGGQVHTILFKTPSGVPMQKILIGPEYANGWTKFAADSLVRALHNPTGASETNTLTTEKDTKALNNGFTEQLSPAPSIKAIFDSLASGTFLPLTYPEGEIAKEPNKKGYYHTILYRSSTGKYFQKSLRAQDRQKGWTTFEANAYIKSIQEQKDI